MEFQVITVPEYVWGSIAGIWVAVTAFFGVSWFRDLSNRVRSLEATLQIQTARISELEKTRERLVKRLDKYGIEEYSDPIDDEPHP